MTELSEQDYQPAVELIPGMYAVGGMLPLDGKISWVPETARGYQPINGYLLLEGDHALLIDTGIPLHRDQVLRQVKELLPEGVEFSIYLTRAELDSVGNCVALATTFDVTSIYTGGRSNPFDAFDQVLVPEGGVDTSKLKTQVFQRMRQGGVPVGGDRRLAIMVPGLRMLSSFWAYDEATKTLFSSDMFGQHILSDSRYDPRITAEQDDSTAESFRAAIEARYWWLNDIEPERLLARLDDVFDTYDIARIAPAHGCVLDEPALVEQQYNFVRGLLTRPVSA